MENKCPYNQKWRFAHGYHELHQRFILNQKYQSKVCESYHINSYCPYGSRWLFQHFNYQKDFRWSYYTNSLKSNFLLVEIAQAKKLYCYYWQLKQTYKDQPKQIAEKLIIAVDPMLQSCEFKVYSRLSAFTSLINDEQEDQSILWLLHLDDNKFQLMKNEDFIYWKWYIKDRIFQIVEQVIQCTLI